ncbi:MULTISPECIES: methyltetrahydrofolate cobalamin methyltransferase [Desulfitobacterium]|uniref:Pterin binding enzyme n=1 Tax=Desulfitobacterium dehalogenans (strain ATCC 51507 / DSM 9161 / JW/IU-DC1) TaxID=756499 RepID=I4A8Z8_DESDJ|nr:MULTISPECIES: methyltetrahydrofolate cobalamin methyltransferase [Desulfitobacterium]AFM00433.1 Pterin binding enzyme [Desulfitobacterium dehalogenans ATCC 51507]
MLIVGELINTSRTEIRTAALNRDAKTIQQVAKAQEEAGASYLDVNCGNLVEQEIATMRWLVDTLQEVSTLPLSIDSPNPTALTEGLQRARHGQPMINSISNESARWRAVVPLVLEYKTKIIALCIEDSGMPKGLEDRLRIADSIINKLVQAGVPLEDIYIDPLVTPISTDQKNGKILLNVIRTIMENYPGIHTICGLSNISYGLPARKVLNRLFMVQTMSAGMDSYILNPTDKGMLGSLKGSMALLGLDRHCRAYNNAYRDGLYDHA